MNWVKRGKIFDLSSGNIPDWMSSHASVPFVDVLNEDGIIKVYFSSRDECQRSHLNYFVTDIFNENKIIEIGQNKLLSPGKLGCFDDSGVMASCLLKEDGLPDKLYYIGWNLGVTVPFRNAIGLAESSDGEHFNKLFEGPIIDRSKTEPHFCASCCVIKDLGRYKIWYLSCVGWSKIGTEVRHHYHIKYAESDNGIDWVRNGDVAIDFECSNEYAISVPRVLKIDGRYHMWFSSRGSKTENTYRIRYAQSADGIVWKRQKKTVLDISTNGWDSEMVCYPCVFTLKNKLYMLYNGNGYGKSGIGLAEADLVNII